jgi:hypothetical protein
MICKRGDKMYTAKVSNDIIIDEKNGEVKLNDLKIYVDGYSEPSLIEKAKNDYNSEKKMTTQRPYKSSDWPKGTWYDMYCNMCRNLQKWKKRVYKKD